MDNKMISTTPADYKLEALSQAYNTACDNKNYTLCNLLRAEIERELSGKKMLIKIENDLCLNPMDVFR
jgi:hypothetical protein